MRFCQLKRFQKISREKFYLLDIDKKDNHYLINVSGSTYNVYNVKLYFSSKTIYCNCPDSKKWAKIDECQCKHICFVLNKVFGLDEDIIENYNINKKFEYEIYNKCVDKITKINFNTDINNDIINDHLISKFNELKTAENEPKEKIFINESKVIDSDCPICYDKLENDILKCPSCKNSIHKTCMEAWLNCNHDSCPYCRSTIWQNYINKEKGQIYLNLS